MSTLTLLRHGQALFGAEHYDQLSPLGLAQARATGDYFKAHALRFDAVYSGPRQRQYGTARAVLEAQPPSALIIEPALDEFADGEQILKAVEHRTGIPAQSDPQLPRREKLRLYGEHIQLWAQGKVSIDGALSASAFRGRCGDWLRQLIDDPQTSRSVLAVTSAGVIAAMVSEVLQLPDAAMGRLMAVIGNASLTTILWSRHGCSLESFNQTAHLPASTRSAI